MIIVIMPLLPRAAIAIVSMICDGNNEETILLKDNKLVYFFMQNFTKHTSVLKSNQNKKMIKYGKVVECHNNSNPKKDNNLKSVGICDTNKLAGLLNKQTHKINENRLESDYYCQEKIYLKQSHVSKDSLAIKLSKSMKVSNVSSKSLNLKILLCI